MEMKVRDFGFTITLNSVTGHTKRRSPKWLEEKFGKGL